MVDVAIMYPKRFRKSLHILMDEVGIGVETAYAMMLMTATLMDLRPEDEKVVNIILKDCGIEV